MRKVCEIKSSAVRSVEIVNYLYALGINTDRMKVENWEIEKMVINCSEVSPCSEASRAKNRRTELKIIDTSALQKSPDLLLTYDFSEWHLTEYDNAQVNNLKKTLEENSTFTVTLDGYTDTWGSSKSNYGIGQLRVNNIRRILVEKGIEPKRIKTVNHGERIPTGDCMLYYPCPINARKQNRRVEIRINMK